jgi:AcrR family transcriptional regulator
VNLASSPGGPGPGLRADAARNVAQIRQAAIAAFHGRGLDTPLEEIAAAAGVAKGTIYHRFGGRLGLIDAVIGDLVGGRMDEIANRAKQIDDPWDSLAYYVSERRVLHYDEPAAIDALILAYPQSEQLAALAESATRTTTDLIGRARAAGVIRPDFTTNDLYHADVGNALALRHLPKPTPSDYNRRTRMFIDSLRAPEPLEPGVCSRGGRA